MIKKGEEDDIRNTKEELARKKILGVPLVTQRRMVRK